MIEMDAAILVYMNETAGLVEELGRERDTKFDWRQGNTLFDDRTFLIKSLDR